MEKKKVLLLDVDEVICFSNFLPLINAFLGTSYFIDDFEDYYIDAVAIPKERFAEFNQFIHDKNLYENAFLLPNAIEVIQKLNEVYDVYICSSCINPFDIENSGRLFVDKFSFLIHFFPFLSADRFIFTGAKHLLKADIQIDDLLSNLHSDVKTKILFPSYHNKNVTDEELALQGVIRAGNDWREGWKNIENILLDKEI